MKNEVLLTQYEASFGHEAKRAGENSFFMMRSIASCAQHASCAARRASLKKACCEASGFFLVGEDGFVCIFIPLWGMKIKVLTPSSRRQATVPRTVAFWIFESALQPSKRTKRPIQKGLVFLWWGRTDSNHRSETQQIYSLSPLATRELPQICGCVSKTWLL